MIWRADEIYFPFKSSLSLYKSRKMSSDFSLSIEKKPRSYESEIKLKKKFTYLVGGESDSFAGTESSEFVDRFWWIFVVFSLLLDSVFCKLLSFSNVHCSYFLVKMG